MILREVTQTKADEYCSTEMKATLTVEIDYTGDCQKADVRETLLHAAHHLADNGMLTPVHDCELQAWECNVTFKDATPARPAKATEIGRAHV